MKISKVLAVAAAVLLLAVAACDSPMDPLTTPPAEVVGASYAGPTLNANGSRTIEINGMLYDIGCPWQCWLPAQIADLVEQEVAAGVARINWASSPPFVLIGPIPVFLYNGRAAPPPPVCSDGLDNDGDGKVDYPADPGCVNPQDDDETDPAGTLLPPVLTGPQRLASRGVNVRVWPLNMPFMKNTYLECRMSGTLSSQDNRVWTAIAAAFNVVYRQYNPTTGDHDVVGQGGYNVSPADIQQFLGGGFWFRSTQEGVELEITVQMVVRANDGQIATVFMNGKKPTQCGI